MSGYVILFKNKVYNDWFFYSGFDSFDIAKRAASIELNSEKVDCTIFEYDLILNNDHTQYDLEYKGISKYCKFCNASVNGYSVCSSNNDQYLEVCVNCQYVLLCHIGSFVIDNSLNYTGMIRNPIDGEFRWL